MPYCSHGILFSYCPIYLVVYSSLHKYFQMYDFICCNSVMATTPSQHGRRQTQRAFLRSHSETQTLPQTFYFCKDCLPHSLHTYWPRSPKFQRKQRNARCHFPESQKDDANKTCEWYFKIDPASGSQGRKASWFWRLYTHTDESLKQFSEVLKQLSNYNHNRCTLLPHRN